jgi:hypothetical protein
MNLKLKTGKISRKQGGEETEGIYSITSLPAATLRCFSAIRQGKMICLRLHSESGIVKLI